MSATFIALCALLTLAALAFLVWPLLKPARHDANRERLAALNAARAAGVLDEAEFTAKRAALQTSSPIVATAQPARGMALALALLVPLLAAGLYLKLGNPKAFDPVLATATATPATDPSATSAPNMDEAIAAVRERLAQNPSDLQGWLLLGRALKSMERFEEARDAFTKTQALMPDSPDVMVELAEAQVLASPSKQFTGEPMQLLQTALEKNPDHQRGLWLLGISQVQAGNSEAGIATWEKLLAVLPADAPVRKTLLDNIAQIRAETGLAAAATTPGTAPPATNPAATTDSASPRLIVEVELAPELASRVAPGDTLFVFARAPQGPKMPLAIQRLSASALPLHIELSNDNAMLPQMNLSSMAQVVVGARISKSGNAQAQSGDLETLSAPVANSQAEPIRLVIDSIVP